jgi:hypothetical protein
MNRFTHMLIKVGAIATLAVGSYALPALALATPPASTAASTTADIQIKSNRYATRAADLQARMRVDEKHAMQWFTLANRLDRKAQTLRMADASGAAPRL